jgi:hypothetical protein
MHQEVKWLLEQCKSVELALEAMVELAEQMREGGLSPEDLGMIAESLRVVQKEQGGDLADRFFLQIASCVPRSFLRVEPQCKYPQFWTEKYLLQLLKDRALPPQENYYEKDGIKYNIPELQPGSFYDELARRISEPRSFALLMQLQYRRIYNEARRNIHPAATALMLVYAEEKGLGDLVEEMCQEQGAPEEDYVVGQALAKKADDSLPHSTQLGLVLTSQLITGEFTPAQLSGRPRRVLNVSMDHLLRERGLKTSSRGIESYRAVVEAVLKSPRDAEELRCFYFLALILGEDPSVPRAEFLNLFANESLLPKQFDGKGGVHIDSFPVF